MICIKRTIRHEVELTYIYLVEHIVSALTLAQQGKLAKSKTVHEKESCSFSATFQPLLKIYFLRNVSLNTLVFKEFAIF